MSATEHVVWINARFLQRTVTGVERVARELITALAARLDDSGSCVTDNGTRLSFRLIAPLSMPVASPWPNISLHRAGWGGGHVWEQTTLPAVTSGEWLISLCNTGPLFKRRQVLFIHDAQPFAVPDSFTWQFRWWYRVLYSVAGRMVDVILTNSKHSKDELVRRVGLDPEKIRETWLGVEHVKRTEPDDSVFARHRLPAEPYLLAVSSVNPNKNFRCVLKALDILGPDAPPCVIAGQRYDRVFGDTHLDESRIRHVGYVSDAELYALYSRALCLLFPSFYEGFGLPPVEAMTLGCPAIVSETSVMPEICGEAALYCDPSHPETLAAAIMRLRTEPGLREHLLMRGRERARLFSWTNGARSLLETLEKGITKYA